MRIDDSMFTRPGRKGLTAIGRFWQKVNKNGPTMPHMTTPCWEWMSAHDGAGYAVLRVAGKNIHASRIAVAMRDGSIDREMDACHHCDNRMCVNPEHIFVGSALDNMRDKVKKGRQAKGETSGHYTMPWRTARGDRNGSRVHPESRKRGADNHMTVLTPDQVRAVRAMLAENKHTISHIARTFGVHRTAIYGIKSGKNWSHLP
jgi:hypothetical protein